MNYHKEVNQYLDSLALDSSKQVNSFLGFLQQSSTNFNFDNSIRIHKALGGELLTKFKKSDTAKNNKPSLTLIAKLKENPYGIAGKTVRVTPLETQRVKARSTSVNLTADKLKDLAVLIALIFKKSVSFNPARKADINIDPDLPIDKQTHALLSELSRNVTSSNSQRRLLTKSLSSMAGIQDRSSLRFTHDFKKEMREFFNLSKELNKKLDFSKELNKSKNYVGTKVIPTQKGDIGVIITKSTSGELVGKAIGINGEARGKAVNINPTLQKFGSIKGEISNKQVSAIFAKIESLPLAKKLQYAPTKTTQELRQRMTEVRAQTQKLSQGQSLNQPNKLRT